LFFKPLLRADTFVRALRGQLGWLLQDFEERLCAINAISFGFAGLLEDSELLQSADCALGCGEGNVEFFIRCY
jgi:hypothetical protein